MPLEIVGRTEPPRRRVGAVVRDVGVPGDCRILRMALAFGSLPWPLPCAAHGPVAGPRSGARARPLSPVRRPGCRRRVGLDLYGALPRTSAGDVDLAMQVVGAVGGDTAP